VHGRRAIPEVLLPHLGAAYNVAFWLIQNEREARGIVEEAYAEARRDLERLGATDARVWLLKIVLRIAHMRMQRRNLHQRPGDRGLS
jgi:RNA polymerase sigma-70 factor, ECF subfamily